MATPEQQRQWGEALAAVLDAWPQIQTLCKTGISHDPAPVVKTLTRSPPDQQTSLSSVFTLLEGAITHIQRVAESDRLEMQERATAAQLKEEEYKDKVEDLTTALAKAVTLGGTISRSNNKRISTDPEKFSGIEKVISKRQQQYLTWRSQLLSVFGRDKHIFNTEYLRIQHIASLLKDDAYDNHREHFETITLNEGDPSQWYWQTSRDVFAELNNQYETLDLSRQANIDFDCLWMKNTPYQNFIAEFDRLADKSGKTNHQKVDSLKAKVSQELSDVALSYQNKPGPAEYIAWRKLYQTIYQDLQEKAHIDKQRNAKGIRQVSQATSQARAATAAPHTIPRGYTTPMDIGDPMVLDAHQSLRPGKEREIKEGLCFYCKKPGHNKANCEEKKAKDAQFGGNFRPRNTVPYHFNPEQLRSQFPNRSSQYSSRSPPSFLLSRHPYSHLRTIEGGFVEGEVQSSTASSPSSSIYTPLSTRAPSISPSEDAGKE
jgi:hypothetical protein